MITSKVSLTLLSAAVSELTPLQRWQAARWFNNIMNESWFMIASIIAVFGLVMLLVLVTYYRIRNERNKINQLFIDYAEKRGLSSRERYILMDIANKAKLKRSESIFTMSDVFDRGATQIIRVAFAQYGAQRSRFLSAELSVLREKLGFRRRKSNSIDLAVREKEPTSRQIAIGRKLYLTSLDSDDFFEVEAEVKENNELELIVELTKPLELRQGTLLCARYYYGAPVWEFDTSIVEVKDNILVLNQSENVRFVNRRRFLRVPVNEQAFVAAFPFSKIMENEEKKSDTSTNSWGPPEFVPADVTELAGPGLRAVAPLEVKVGDRVAIILKLSQTEPKNLMHSDFRLSDNFNSYKIVEDIGIVRHTENVEDGLSIAVELTGLNDSNVSELVRATNIVSINNKNKASGFSNVNKRNVASEAIIG